MSSYIIVGAGVFGASTAYHLKRQFPLASIVLIDRTWPPCPIAASHDINKIIRADYEDPFYCGLALKALLSWKTDPFYKQWFHPSGLLTITDKESHAIENIVENFKKLDVKYEPDLIRPEALGARFAGIFSDMNLRPDDKLLFDGLAGIAEAEKALGATIKASVELGVEYIADPVSKLVMSDGMCSGVQTRGGKTITAAKVLLCTGANTARLIADSAPDRPEMQVGARITARAVCTAAVELDSGGVTKFGKVPAVVHHSGTDQGKLRSYNQHSTMLTILSTSRNNATDRWAIEVHQ